MRLISKVVDSKSSQNSSTYSVTKKSYSFTKSSSSSKFAQPSTTGGNWPPRQLKRSQSITEVIESNRCFKPSDATDPGKKAFLTNLTQRVFKVGLVSYLEKLHHNRKFAHRFSAQIELFFLNFPRIVLYVAGNIQSRHIGFFYSVRS